MRSQTSLQKEDRVAATGVYPQHIHSPKNLTLPQGLAVLHAFILQREAKIS
jgi:hypothetical protein